MGSIFGGGPKNMDEPLAKKRRTKPNYILDSNILKVECKRKEYGEGESMFFTALTMGLRDVAQYLLDIGTNIDEIDGRYDETALHFFARSNKLQKIDFLIRNHANLEATDIYGHTPLFDAISNGHLKAIQRLIRAGANVNVQSLTEGAPLHAACTLKQPKAKLVLDLLLLGGVIPDLVDNSGKTALHHIAAKGYCTCIVALMVAHFNINAKDNNGSTPLHLATDQETIRTLIRYHADIDAQDINGCTALHLAIKTKNEKAVDVLFDNNARLTARDRRLKN